MPADTATTERRANGKVVDAAPRKRTAATSEGGGDRLPPTPDPAGDGGRAVVTLSPPAASAARRLAAAMGGVSLPEVVRRGLMLLDAYLGLRDDEELVIRNRRTSEIERIRFTWETF